MGVMFVVFAVAMAVATFLENDFGSAAAYNMVYNTRWFELILLLLAINLVGQLIVFKLFKRTRITGALFHLSFIIMILGAGITRYFGWEGTIHIREGESQNECFSNEKYIGYSVKDSTGKVISQHQEKYTMTSVSADNYKKKIKINNKYYQLELSKIIPNASEVITDNPGGETVVSLVLTKNMTSKETVVLKKGETKVSDGIFFSFDSNIPADLNISTDSGKFFITPRFEIGEMSMTSNDITNIEPGKRSELKLMQVLTVNGIKIIPLTMSFSGNVKAIQVNPAEENTGVNAFIFHISEANESETLYLWDRNSDNSATASCILNGYNVEINYGAKISVLPFSIKLNHFILDRYPGSNSPSGYKSDVTLTDQKAGVEKPFMIFMNNILKYKGYRFYQSSFDQDEKGTILSVNHDQAGMLVTYSGYALLFIFIILSLLNNNSVFHKINAGYWQSNLRKLIPALIIVLFLSGLSSANAQKLIPDKRVSVEFGKVLVQDQKGRTKPLFTLSNDILRKVTRKNEFEGLSSMQVFLGIYLDFNNWKDVPLIVVSNKDLQAKLGIKGKYASFSNLVDIGEKGSYKIADEVNSAYSKAPGERNKMDKEVMKIDERVNIIYMIFKGDFLKLFPLRDGSNELGIT